MQALLKTTNGVRLADIALPGPGSDEVLVKVALAGICKTDLALAKGIIACQDNLVLGHEFCGTVVKAAGAPDLVGSRVAVQPVLSHASAWQTTPGFLGINRHGGFAEFVSVPKDYLFRLPDSVSFAQAVFLEPIAAAAAVLKAIPQNTGKILILGNDRIALLTRLVLENAGHLQIEMFSPSEKSSSCTQHIYDRIIVTKNDSQWLNAAIELVAPGGSIIIKSRWIEPAIIDMAQALEKEALLVPVNYAPFVEAFKLLCDDTFRSKLTNLAGKNFRLDEFSQALSQEYSSTQFQKSFFVF